MDVTAREGGAGILKHHQTNLSQVFFITFQAEKNKKNFDKYKQQIYPDKPTQNKKVSLFMERKKGNR